MTFIFTGDAGFPQEHVLLTPYRNAQVGSREQHFNHKHSQARSIIERVIGILKSRFRCLLGARELHYSPTKATSIINVCVALHNICRTYRVEDPPNEAIQSIVNEIDNLYNGSEEDSATRIRDNIRDCLWCSCKVVDMAQSWWNIFIYRYIRSDNTLFWYVHILIVSLTLIVRIENIPRITFPATFVKVYLYIVFYFILSIYSSTASNLTSVFSIRFLSV